MRVDSFKFGDIVINGSHHQDCKLYADGTVHRWDYYEHHTVILRDIRDMIKDIDFFVIGTGESSLVRVEQDVVDALNEMNVKVFIRPTGEAIKKINELAENKKRFAAILHSTC